MHSLLVRRSAVIAALLALSLIVCAPAIAQQAAPENAQQNSSGAQRVFTDADYAHAEKFMPYNIDRLVYGTVRPSWLPNHRFWYRSTTAGGSEFVVVNAATGDHYDARHLPFLSFVFSRDERSIFVDAKSKHFQCTLQASDARCFVPKDDARLLDEEDHAAAFHDALAHNESLSPDGKKVVFIRDYNLWLRDLATGKETQLTKIGRASCRE